MAFKEKNVLAIFSRHVPRRKNGLPDMDFYKFFFTIHSKNNM